MKPKPIRNIEEYTKYLTPEGKVFFFDSSDSSPVSEISMPSKGIFMGIHGSWTASGARGTVYVGRDDSDDTVAINIYPYPFSISEDNTGELSAITKNTEYHHTDEIPDSWEAPCRIINRVEEIRRFRRISSAPEILEESPEDDSNQVH